MTGRGQTRGMDRGGQPRRGLIVLGLVVLGVAAIPVLARAEWAGPDPAEREVLASLRGEKFIRAREQAERILNRDPSSIVARYALAMVFHDEEANLPRALFHIRKAEQSLIARFGKEPREREAKLWHARILDEEATILGEMDRRDEQLRVMDRHDALYRPKMDRHRIWPLMKQHRFEEALALARKVSLDAELYTRISGLNGMIAIESERLDPRACFEVGLKGVKATGYQSCILNQNTAEAAFAVYRFREAEELANKSIQASIQDCPASAYPYLANLYLLRADFQRAMEAVKSARGAPVERRYRQQFEMTNTAWLARLLYALGHFQRALDLAERVLQAPDRVGMLSFSDEVMRVIFTLDLHAALLARLEAIREEISVRPLSAKGQHARLTAVADLSLRAFAARRRIARLLAESDDLVHLVRPYLKPLPPWNSGALVRAMGHGVLAEALDQARKREKLPATSAYFAALEGEMAFDEGDFARARALGQQVLSGLPTDEVLLRGRVAAFTAASALRLGDRTLAATLLHQVLDRYPTVLRLLGIRLPVDIQAGPQPEAQTVARRLLGSRRLQPGQPLFTVRVTGSGETLRICLEGGSGRRYACATLADEDPQARERRDEAPEDRITRLLDRFHDKVFAPKIDLTQRDINSLDGSAVRGEADQVLKEVLGE